MDGWQQDWTNMLETLANEAERFFQDVSKEVNEVAEAFIDFSEELADQLHTAIAPSLEEFDTHIEEWLDPFLQALVGLEATLGEAVEPMAHTVEPMLNEHPACVGCRHYHGQSYSGTVFVCAMHPYGWDLEQCPDWESTWQG